MAIFVHDTRDKAGKHDNVDSYLISRGHQIVRSKLYVGDITLLHDQRVCIDLKRNLAEVVTNVTQQHERFTGEIRRAQDANIRLIFLIEHGGVKTLDDVRKWKNPRLKVSPLAVSGERLFKIMYTMAQRYDVDWEFCDKRCTGKKVLELLGASEISEKGLEE